MYFIEQRVFLAMEFDRLENSFMATCRSFQNRFKVSIRPDAKTIRLFVKFEQTAKVADDRKGNVGRGQTVITPENAAKVSGIVQQNPRKKHQTDCISYKFEVH